MSDCPLQVENISEAVSGGMCCSKHHCSNTGQHVGVYPISVTAHTVQVGIIPPQNEVLLFLSAAGLDGGWWKGDILAVF